MPYKTIRGKKVFLPNVTSKNTDSHGRFIPDAPWYVTSTDTFFSGSDPNRGKKINRLVFPAKDLEEARIVEDNLKHKRTDQANIRLSTHRPKFDKSRIFVDVFPKTTSEKFYKKDADFGIKRHG